MRASQSTSANSNSRPRISPKISNDNLTKNKSRRGA